MKFVTLCGCFALLIVAGASLGCSGSADYGSPQPTNRAANDNANTTKSQEEELGLIVTIPFEAEDIVWKEDEANKKLIAVFRFSPENSAKVVADAEKFGAPKNITLGVESWFPAELTAQGEMSGDSSLKGLVYPANSFYMAAYKSGRLTRIEGGDYFILELTEK